MEPLGTELKIERKKRENLHILTKNSKSTKAFFTLVPYTYICGEIDYLSPAPRITSPRGQTDKK
jgi:hypothetical protein